NDPTKGEYSEPLPTPARRPGGQRATPVSRKGPSIPLDQSGAGCPDLAHPPEADMSACPRITYLSARTSASQRLPARELNRDGKLVNGSEHRAPAEDAFATGQRRQAGENSASACPVDAALHKTNGLRPSSK